MGKVKTTVAAVVGKWDALLLLLLLYQGGLMVATNS